MGGYRGQIGVLGLCKRVNRNSIFDCGSLSKSLVPQALSLTWVPHLPQEENSGAVLTVGGPGESGDVLRAVRLLLVASLEGHELPRSVIRSRGSSRSLTGAASSFRKMS